MGRRGREKAEKLKAESRKEGNQRRWGTESRG
jgi:hypothetical protein